MVSLLGLTACADDSQIVDPEVRAVSLGFEDVANADTDWSAVRADLESVNANAVHLAVGRVEWSAFPWAKHADRNSSLVEETGTDYVQRAIDEVGTQPDGTPRRIVLTIDALIPELIAADPELAGVDASGQRSESFSSASALADGPVGDRLVEMVGYVARTYDADEVTLTEIMFDGSTFGDDDRELYMSMFGAADWPRDADGAIDTGHPSIGAWRSQVIAQLASRARVAANAAGSELALDVRTSWEDPVSGRAESGHDLSVLAGAVDRLIVWNYFGMSGASGDDSTTLTRAFRDAGIDPTMVTMSVGLWTDDGDVLLDPADFGAGVRASASYGVTSVAVTPRSLMTRAHWDALASVWSAE
ncbi:hypothetical protein [Pseudoclavibacter sp. RFBB5]|uniref:hypothetical protein n=1 Tax=Pseudoclavibacter sp. RFBB5 TaxID=2080574 RepID=UPI000CE8424C|nr:hypothetical protein [Pseudoclavibacter sp. RFBB5]PPG29763.1 hypothetical protein C5B97_12470 [Pseudoclavibacter sp. RFBB5]